MSDEMKLGRMARDADGTEIRIQRAEGGKPMQLSFPLSSEAPVDRWFGTEILSHEGKAVRLDRVSVGAMPLLFNHDWSDPVGMVDGGRVKDGRLWIDAHLFDTQRARDLATMVEGGLRNVSVGYEILEMTEDVKRNVFTATEWMPLEASIVTVPADITVGINRSDDTAARPVRLVRGNQSQPAAPAALERKTTMVENQAAAVASAETKIVVTEDHSNRPSAAELEKSRQNAIRNFAKSSDCDERFVDRWIRDGVSLEVVAEDLMEIRKQRSQTKAVTFLDMPRRDLENYSITRALRAAQSKDWTHAGLELEANKELTKRLARLPKSPTSFFVPLDAMVRQHQVPQQRDMTVAGVSGSNYLVSTDNQAGSFIEMLRNNSVTLAMGVSRLSGLQGNVTIPKMTAGNTAYWLADETTAITESQPTLGQLALAPKNVAAMTELSHQLMQQSSPDVEALVMNSIARDIALAVDVGVLRGSGSSGQPTGIVTTGSIGAFTGTSLAAPGVLNAIADVASANALNAGCGFVTTPAVAALLMDRPNVTSATDGTPLWQGRMEDGSIRGYRAMASNQMSAATALFGWWPSVVLAEWGVLELMANPFSDFTRGLTSIRGWYTCDVGVRYAGAWSYSSSIT